VAYVDSNFDDINATMMRKSWSISYK